MGKRSSFARRARDFYPTPVEAAAPLLPHLAPGVSFAEPCAGDGALIDHLQAAGHWCAQASDIAPRRGGIARHDALTVRIGAGLTITNPPWGRAILHPLITHLRRQAPCWLLFDADWIHTAQARPFKPWLARVVSVGRVRWIEGSKSTGKDNCAWYLFTPGRVVTEFYVRGERPVGEAQIAFPLMPARIAA
jgi:hypothetical protein